MKNKVELKDIRIRKETKEQLDKLKHAGQSYDGIIRELIAYKESKIKEV